MNNPFETRKVIWGVVLALLWMCVFIFFKDSLVIQWNLSDTSNLTPLKPYMELIGLFVVGGYILFVKAGAETKKLLTTAVLTICWLAMILFFPFKTSDSGGAVGFFALIIGLAVVVLWVRFFSDEIIPA